MRNQSRKEALGNANRILGRLALVVVGLMIVGSILGDSNEPSNNIKDSSVEVANATSNIKDSHLNDYVLENQDLKIAINRLELHDSYLYIFATYTNKESEPKQPFDHITWNISASQEDDTAVYSIDYDLFVDTPDAEYNEIGIDTPKYKTNASVGIFLPYELELDTPVRITLERLFSSEPEDELIIDLDKIDEINAELSEKD